MYDIFPVIFYEKQINQLTISKSLNSALSIFPSVSNGKLTDEEIGWIKNFYQFIYKNRSETVEILDETYMYANIIPNYDYTKLLPWKLKEYVFKTIYNISYYEGYKQKRDELNDILIKLGCEFIPDDIINGFFYEPTGDTVLKYLEVIFLIFLLFSYFYCFFIFYFLSSCLYCFWYFFFIFCYF